MATGTRQIRRFQRPHSSLKTSQQETPSNIYKRFILPETRVIGLHFGGDSVGLHGLTAVDIWVSILLVDADLNVPLEMQKPVFFVPSMRCTVKLGDRRQRKPFWKYSVPNAYLHCYTQQKRVRYYLVTSINSLEFTLTRLFMKIFRTASPAVVTECQRSFCFLPVTSQIVIRTAKFLQVFLGTDNSLCQLFHGNLLNNQMTFSVNTMFVLQVSLRAQYMICSL